MDSSIPCPNVEEGCSHCILLAVQKPRCRWKPRGWPTAILLALYKLPTANSICDEAHMVVSAIPQDFYVDLFSFDHEYRFKIQGYLHSLPSNCSLLHNLSRTISIMPTNHILSHGMTPFPLTSFPLPWNHVSRIPVCRSLPYWQQNAFVSKETEVLHIYDVLSHVHWPTDQHWISVYSMSRFVASSIKSMISL